MENLKVLFEDNHIIVVEKPVNIPSQGDKTGDEDMLSIIKKYLIEKYNVKIPEKIKDKAKFKEGELKILSKEVIEKMIEDIRNIGKEEVKIEGKRANAEINMKREVLIGIKPPI